MYKYSINIIKYFLGDFHLHLRNKNIAVLKNSQESTIIQNDYAKSIIKEFETYGSVIKAVSTQKVLCRIFKCRSCMLDTES